jgi:hypothetical protein
MWGIAGDEGPVELPLYILLLIILQISARSNLIQPLLIAEVPVNG